MNKQPKKYFVSYEVVVEFEGNILTVPSSTTVSDTSSKANINTEKGLQKFIEHFKEQVSKHFVYLDNINNIEAKIKDIVVLNIQSLVA